MRSSSNIPMQESMDHYFNSNDQTYYELKDPRKGPLRQFPIQRFYLKKWRPNVGNYIESGPSRPWTNVGKQKFGDAQLPRLTTSTSITTRGTRGTYDSRSNRRCQKELSEIIKFTI